MNFCFRTRVSVTLWALMPFACFSQANMSFLEPPTLIPDPSSRIYYSAEQRDFTGIPSLSVSPGGRLWATWYAGPTPAEDDIEDAGMRKRV